MTNLKLKSLALSLSQELRQLADACETIASASDESQRTAARRLLEDNIDGHWRGIVVGARKVDDLIAEGSSEGETD